MKIRSTFYGLCALALGAAPAGAQVAVWTGVGSDSLWSTAGNWFSGFVPVANGAVQFNSGIAGISTVDSNLSLTGLTFQNTVPLTLNQTGGTFLTISGTNTIAFASNSTVAVNVPLTGTGNLWLNGGTGTLTLNPGGANLNIYSGSTEVFSGGTLSDGAANAFSGNSVLYPGGTGGGTVLVNFNETVAGLNDGGANGSVKLASGVALKLTGAFSTTFSGVISDNGGPGGLIVNGPSTLTLKGSNTYSGLTVINSGGTINIGGGGSTGGIASNSISGAGSLSFDLTTAYTYSGILSGPLNLVQFGTSVTTLSGINTYSGPTTIVNGTLRAGSTSAFGGGTGSSSVSMSGNAVLDLNGFNNFIGSLASVSTANAVTLGSAVLTVGTAFSNTSYAGSITGSGSLHSTGFMLALTGNGNTYSGGTTINGGTLIANNSTPGVSAIGSGPITILPTGTLQIGLGNTNGYLSTTNITDNGTLAISRSDSNTLSNNISGTGGVTMAGTGMETLSGSNTYSGTTSVGAGELIAGSSSAFGGASGSPLAISGGGIVSLNGFNTSVGPISDDGTGQILLGTGTLTSTDSGTSTFGGVISGAGAVTFSGTGTEIETGASTYSGITTINAGATLQLGNGGPTGNLASSGVLGAGTIVFDRSNALSFTPSISGSVSVVQQGSGNTTLSGSNTYSGTTSVNAGTLSDGAANSFSPTSEVLVNAGATLQVLQNEIVGNLENGGAGGNVTIATGRTLASNGMSYVGDFQGVISGNGAFIVAGGVQGLSGNNTYAGGTSVTAGELFVGSNSAVGTGTLTFAAGTQFSPDANVTLANPIVLNGSGYIDNDDGAGNSAVLTGVISGTNGIAWCAPGTLTLTNANTFTGGVDMRVGSLVLGNNTAAGIGGTIILDGSTSLNVMNGVTVSNPLAIANAPNVLTGNGTIATPVTADGSVIIAPAASPGNGPGNLTFSSGLTLASGGAIHFDIYNASGAAGTGYSLFTTTGGLSLTALPNTITFNLVSTDSVGNAASAINFNPTLPYAWMFASSTTPIAGFNQNQFNLVTSGFANSTASGTFSFSEVGNNLFLNFTPVPEPSTWCLMGAGVLAVAPFALRRRRVAKA